MLKFLKKEANRAYTENGAAAYATSCSDCLDLFAAVGALRGAPGEDITGRFMRAYAENPDAAMKILFFARDVRGGLGERRVFRTVLGWLAANQPDSVRKNIAAVPEFGRWDDLLTLMGTVCESDALACIKKQLAADLDAADRGGEVSLLAKWLPSVNASSASAVRSAKRIARALGMNDATYRRTLAGLRAGIPIIENSLRERDYSFDYAKQPSRAMFNYRKAFLRNDGERYKTFLESVSDGKASMHAGTLTPYDIVAPAFKEALAAEERRNIDITWRAQPDYTNGEDALVVVDGSGSMYGGGRSLPAAVALSMGIYFAERNTGAFRGHFITFSENPRLVEIKGGDIMEKLRYCRSFNEVANTDIQKVFELILAAAVKNRLPQSELPSAIYLISDMEFDRCTEGADSTNFGYAKRLFAASGYRLPRVVFWNVASRSARQPVTMNEQGVALVSGCSPVIFSMLTDGAVDPYSCMMKLIGAARYAAIAA